MQSYQIILSDGVIYAATADGLVGFGELRDPAPIVKLPGLESPINPSGVQLLILVLTILLAALVLLGHVKWVLGRQRAGA